MKTLVAVDLSVLAHKINAQRQADQAIRSRKRGHLKSWVLANLAVICTFDWLQIPGLDKENCVLVFLTDSKPYWRAVELKKLGIAYKHGFKSRTRKGLSYIKSVLIRELKAKGLPVLGLPGQEADDMASLLVRSKPNWLSVVLVTTDNDWCGLIDPAKHVSWYCLHGHQPRYRPDLAAVQLSAKGKKSGIKDLKDFYVLKQRDGDPGDNLHRGCPIWAVDLFNPLQEYDPYLSGEQEILLPLYENSDAQLRLVRSVAMFADPARDWLVKTGSRTWLPVLTDSRIAP
jgi:hypothetical protein